MVMATENEEVNAANEEVNAKVLKEQGLATESIQLHALLFQEKMDQPENKKKESEAIREEESKQCKKKARC